VNLSVQTLLASFGLVLLVWGWLDALIDFREGVARIRRGGHWLRLKDILHAYEFEKASNPVVFWCLTAIRVLVLLLLTVVFMKLLISQ